ncbi:acetamidase [Rhodobacteraceae bacterium]|nr:acetamidase [Paracoccaceae bacterium]
MAHHYLPAGPDTVHWGHFDPAAAPVLRIAAGDTVQIDTLSGGPRNLPDAGQGSVLPNHRAALAALAQDLGPHLVTGPIHVEGAVPGDRLIVDIVSVELSQNWGWNAIEPGFGAFPDLATEYENMIIPIDIARSRAALPWGVNVDLHPFFGILAVAPELATGRIGTVVPGAFGGNMDNRFARAGASLHLPVFCEGALFFAGDGHALQGNGEVCDTALETALNGRFRFRLEKGTAPRAPEIHRDDLLVTMAFDPDLDRAAVEATSRMMDILTAQTPLSRREAWRHCSLCADLHITQLVNGKKGVHCTLRRATLPQD